MIDRSRTSLSHYIDYWKYRMMEEDTPLKNFQAKVGDYLLRLNLMSGEASDISHFNEGLSIYVANYVEKYCFEQFYNIQNIPKEALTIFFDLQTFFDYIVENHADANRLRIHQHGVVVSNIIKARGVERRQEVILDMSRKPLEELVKVEEEIKDQGLVKELKEKNQALRKNLNTMQRQLEGLEENSAKSQQKMKYLQAKLLEDSEERHSQLMQQQKNTLILSQNQQSYKQFMNSTRVELRYLIDVVAQLKRQLAEGKQEKEELKEQIREMRKMIKEQKSMGIPKGVKDSSLGMKIDVTVDKSNPFLAKYNISEDCIQKIDGDETRFQVLGNEIFEKAARSYFQVRILNLSCNGLIIGIVSNNRRGQRHSYDQKECICYDGTGKIFEIGKKWPVPVKFQAGQIVRVMVDLQQSIIRWFISYTEVGSAFIPDTLRSSQLVPYIELNQVKDKISLNK